MLSPSAAPSPAAVDPKAIDFEAIDELHRASAVVDTHNDLLMLVTRRPPQAQGRYFRERWLPQLRTGGVDVQVLPVFIDDEYRPEGALRQTLRTIAAAYRIAEDNTDAVTLCTTDREIGAAAAAGRIALVLALEGCEAIGTDVELFRMLHRLGVRMASFTHFGRTALADGSGEDGTGGRLTRAGAEALSLVEELGILMDVSHLSAAGTDHVLSLATRPVVASHSSAFAVQAHHRNLTDERLRGIAATGGVIGINFFAGFVDPRRPTVERVVDHIEHVRDIAGVEHIGLGPDFMKEVMDELDPLGGELMVEGVDARQTIAGLEGPAGLPLVTRELARRGWDERDIRRVLGENWLRVLGAKHPALPRTGAALERE